MALSNYAPIPFHLPPSLLHTLSSPKRLADFADTIEGLNTTNNARFLRYSWETSGRSEWRPYSKGGGYKKWFESELLTVRWGANGERLKRFIEDKYRAHWSKRVSGVAFYDRPGWVYSLMTCGAMGCRVRSRSTIFDVRSGAIFPKGHSTQIVALANSRVSSFLLHSIIGVLDFHAGYVGRLPLLQLPQQLASQLVSKCVELKTECESGHVTGRARPQPKQAMSRAEAALHYIEGVIERFSFDAYELTASETELITSAMGVPVGWYPLLSGYDDWPDDANSESPPQEIQDVLSRHRRLEIHGPDLTQLQGKLRLLFEEGPGANVVITPHDCNDDTEPNGQASDLVPPATFLEELAQQLQINPISVYWMTIEGIRDANWQSTELDRQRAFDSVTVNVLQCLGYRWPTEEERRAPVCADPDGIVPITQTPSEERVLANRIAKLIEMDETPRQVDRIEVLVGKRMDHWLSLRFFAHHVTQFKKRPIAWQLQSALFTSRRTPAYACLAYYHKLDGDLIRKVRKQAEDVRKSFETELRGITSTPADARSDRQEQRRVYLEDGVGELQRFDSTLGQLIQSGFGPEPLVPTLRQYAIDDATLALKARWLRRLSSLVADTTLADWQSAATAAEIHDNLPYWISQAVTHLQHHCATVGIKPPKAKDVGDEPTSADLAPLICSKSAEMLTGSLKCACDVWWKQFNDTVLGPLKEQVKEMKNERKEIKAKLEGDPPPEPDDVTELTLRDRDLREDIKPIEKKIKRLKAKTTVLRKDIESWTSDEALSCVSWLADQPLFDEVTSLDGHKAPPTTIAVFIAQESAYIPDINDGVRVNIAPLQKTGILAADVLAKKDVDKAIADRAEWRADERRWVRQGKLSQCGWWPEGK